MLINKHGYVALFDVLGFSNRVMRGALTDLDGYIKTVSRNAANEDRLGAVLFSDTVLLYTFDDSDDSFQAIVRVSSSLFFDLLRAHVPVRGAISFGDFSRSDREAHGTVVAGRPIIEAHDYESRLQWIGIMLAPSVLEQRPEITKPNCLLTRARSEVLAHADTIHAATRLRFQPCGEIPLQDASGEITLLDGFAIVPLNDAVTLAEMRDRLDESRANLDRLRQIAPDFRSQEKYRRSLDWLRVVHKNYKSAFAAHF